MPIARPIPTPIHLLRANGAWQSGMDGNPRGSNAVDLQPKAAPVLPFPDAPQGESILAAGIDNEPWSEGSVAIGEANVTGDRFFAANSLADGAIGSGNTARGLMWAFGVNNTTDVVGGGGAMFGQGNNVPHHFISPQFVFGADSVVSNAVACSFGMNNRVIGEHDVAFGTCIYDRGEHGVRCWEFFKFANDGDAMYNHQMDYAISTDEMPRQLDYLTAGTTTMFGWGGSHLLRVTATARQTNGNDWAGWVYAILFRHSQGIVDQQELRHDHSAGAATWTLTFDSPGSQTSLNVVGKGQMGKTIRWAQGLDIVFLGD